MSTWTRERAKVAAFTRSRPDDDPDLVAARQKLKELRASDYIRKLVDSSPPLTSEQRIRLAELLKPVQR